MFPPRGNKLLIVD